MTRTAGTVLDQPRSRRTATVSPARVSPARVSTAAVLARAVGSGIGRKPDDRPSAAARVRRSRSDVATPASQLAGLARAFSSLAKRDLPEAWLRPAFAREVELVRLHLRPLGRLPLLAGSFGRESFNFAGPPSAMADGEELLSRSPTHVAYAIRWLEVHGGVSLPPWMDLDQTADQHGTVHPAIRVISALFIKRKPAENVDPPG